jgi:hypothetical protein
MVKWEYYNEPQENFENGIWTGTRSCLLLGFSSFASELSSLINTMSPSEHPCVNLSSFLDNHFFLLHLILSEFSIHTLYNTKLSLCLINYAMNHEGTWESGGIVLPFLTAALDGREWSASEPGHFTPGTYRIGGWVGPRTGLDSMEKRNFLLLPRIKPRPSRLRQYV